MEDNTLNSLRQGWHQLSPYAFEFGAQKPKEAYYYHRRAIGGVRMSSSLAHWKAQRIEWLTETGIRIHPLGQFPPDRLDDAFKIVEQAVAQLSLFEAKT